MQQDTPTTEQKRKSFSGLWILLLAVLVYLSYFGLPGRSRRHEKARIHQDTEFSDPFQDSQSTDESNDENEFNERPETGDLDF